jgi:hypothetical protein
LFLIVYKLSILVLNLRHEFRREQIDLYSGPAELTNTSATNPLIGI